MKTLAITELYDSVKNITKMVVKKPVLITVYDKPKVVIMSVTHYDELIGKVVVEKKTAKKVAKKKVVKKVAKKKVK